MLPCHSSRERHVGFDVARGLANKQIAALLGISKRTVENHLRSIFDKLHINTRTRLISFLHQRHYNLDAGNREQVISALAVIAPFSSTAGNEPCCRGIRIMHSENKILATHMGSRIRRPEQENAIDSAVADIVREQRRRRLNNPYP